jgi:group I intron endonuclease
MKISCVYKITNKINNKVYVGSTCNYIKRITSHKNLLIKNKHSNDHLQSSWNKYGSNSFEFSIIEHIEPEKLIKLETNYIELYKSSDRELGYNQQKPSNSRAGFEHTEESKEKISQNRSGISHTNKTKQQISQTMKKVVLSRNPESYKKMAHTKKNKPIPKLYKKVRCLELDKVFNSIQEAASELKLQRTGISMVLSGKISRTGGFTFERVNHVWI